VIYGSSVAVFDDNEALPTGDFRPYGPPAVYGVTKMFVEQLAQAMQRDNPGTDFLGIRYGWVYGPGRVRGWTEIQEVIENFSLEKKIIDFPNYQKPLDWTYIDDAVEAMVRCLQNPFLESPVLNFSGDYRSINDANNYLKSLFPKAKLRPYPAELPPVGWGFKSDGIITHPGYSFQTSLEQGLLKTVNWIRAQNKLSMLPA
jgi:UDP-glucose 4-epimerase